MQSPPSGVTAPSVGASGAVQGTSPLAMLPAKGCRCDRRGGILYLTPHFGDCHHWVIPAHVKGEPVQAVVGNRDKPARAEPAYQELKKPPASFLAGAFLCLQRCKQL